MPIDPMTGALIAARGIHFASVMALFGGAFFPLVLTSAPEVRTLFSFAPLRWWMRGASLAGVVSGVGWMAASFASMAGDVAALFDRDSLAAFFLATSFGPVEMARLLLLAALLVFVVVPIRCRVMALALVAISGALLVSQGWIGHAAVAQPGLDALSKQVSYAVHVLAAGVWLGGLPPLGVALGGLRRVDQRHAAWRLLADFSRAATVAVTAIVISGAANTYFRFQGAPASSLRGAYALVLATKLTLVALLLGLAAYNRFVAMPRLEGRGVRSDVAMSRLRLSILGEQGVALLVLAAAAWLGVTPPPH